MPAQPQSAGPTPRKRFRTTADLSDEQIQHKRIVDRRNQQAFRQRARDSFRSLKEEHAQLEEKCEGLESELATARDRIEVLTGCIRSMQGLASTVLGESSMANSEMGPVHMPPQPTLTHGDHSTPSATGQTLHATAPSASTSPHHIAEGQSPRSLPYTNPGEGRVSHDNSHSNACQSSDMALTEHQAPQENSLEDRPLETHLTPGGPSTHVQYAFSSPSSIITNLTTVPWQQATGSGAAYLTVPSFLEPTCPLDQILLDFLRKSHRMILQGATTDAAVGPNWLSVRSLLHRDQATPANPLNTIMSHVLNTFTHVGVVEKLAFFYLMSHTMRVGISLPMVFVLLALTVLSGWCTQRRRAILLCRLGFVLQ